MHTSDTLTISLSLLAAILFAFGNQFSRLALRFVDFRTAALWQIGVSVGIYWLAAPFYMQAWYWTASVMPLLIALGFLRPLISANLGMAGTRILGPTISATLAATSPLFGVALGVVLLTETLSLEIVLGTAGIVAGVVLISLRGRSARSWPLIALLLPVGAAFIRSLVQAFSKIALNEIPSPFFVALIAYSVAFICALASHLYLRQPILRSVPAEGMRWLIVTGIAYGGAVVTVNTALLEGRLVVVAPTIACAPIFTLLLGSWVFKEESIDSRVAIAALAVAASVALIGWQA